MSGTPPPIWRGVEVLLEGGTFDKMFETLINAWERADRDRRRGIESFPRWAYGLRLAAVAFGIACLIAGVIINPHHHVPWFVWMIAALLMWHAIWNVRKWLR
jgi:ABC-type xylose transport system permease subunit